MAEIRTAAIPVTLKFDLTTDPDIVQKMRAYMDSWNAQIRSELVTDHELVLLGQWAANKLYEDELSLDEAKKLVAKLVTVEDWRR